MIIDGSSSVNVTVSGNQSRVFEISSGTAVTFTTLTITRGELGCPGCPYGHGAGILNEGGSLFISNSTFKNNSVFLGNGGAIASNGGELEIRDTLFLTNSAMEGASGGIFCIVKMTSPARTPASSQPSPFAV